MQTESRTEYVTKGALRFARSQGASDETAYAFAAYAIEHCPEVQSFSNLFDCFMSQQPCA